MKAKNFILAIILVLFLGGILWANQTGAPSTPTEPTSAISPSPVTSGDDVQPGSKVHDLPIEPAAQKAREDLAETLGVSADEIVILQVQDIQWPDACLGIPSPEEICAQIITPGFKVAMKYQGESYVYRTNEDGSSVRTEE